jgi:hypothetical protein
MDCCRVEEMVIDLVVIGNRSDYVCADVLLIVESLQLAPYSAVAVFDEFRFRIVVSPRLLGKRNVAIIPLLDFNHTSPVVDFVSNVGGLGADIANLPDERNLAGISVLRRYCAEPSKGTYMTNSHFIDLVTCVGIWLFCVEDLLDGERTHGVFPVVSLMVRIIKSASRCEEHESHHLGSPPCRQQDCL